MDTAHKIDEDQALLGQEMAGLSHAFGGDIIDPHQLFRELARARPVHPGDVLARFGMKSMASSGVDRPVFTLFRHKDVLAVLRDAATFTSGINQERMGFLFDDLMILGMDGADHHFMRSLLQPAFGGGVVARWSKRLIRPLIETEFVAPLLAKGHCELFTDFAIPFPVRSVYQIIGLPDDPKAYAQFAAWGLQILAAPTGDAERDPEGAQATREAALRASRGMYDQLLPIIAARRASGAVEGDDLIASLLRASHDGRALNDHEIACFLRTVLPASAESTTRTFANLVSMVLADATLEAALRADRGLIGAAIDEAVRLEPVISVITRKVEADVTISGTTIPRGAAVLLCIAAASRDGEVYADPERFDVHRPRRIPLGFGSGPHMCIGMQVAKVEMVTALNLLFDRMPRLRLDPDYPPPEIAGVLFRSPAALHVRWD